MRIFGWASDEHGCGYYRVALPLRELRQQNSDWRTAAGTIIDLESAASADLLICQRTHTMLNSGWFQTQQPARLVYELDDDLWRVHPTNPNYSVFRRQDTKDRLTRNVAHAGTVTVSTDALADVIRPINPNVHVLPNCVAAALLDHQRPRRDTLTVGWAGSATHLNDFREAVGPLKRFFAKYPQVDMHFIGMDYSPLIRHGYATGWVSGVEDYLRVIDFDIGLAPLWAEPFNESKSPLKALEYAALGIPIIASDTGPYRQFVRDGVTGFLCKTEHDWLRALRTLAEDPGMRAAMGHAGREQAAEHTIQGNAWRWAEVYEQALAAV